MTKHPLVGHKVIDTKIGNRKGKIIAVDEDMQHVTIQWHDRSFFVTSTKVEPGRYNVEL